MYALHTVLLCLAQRFLARLLLLGGPSGRIYLLVQHVDLSPHLLDVTFALASFTLHRLPAFLEIGELVSAHIDTHTKLFFLCSCLRQSCSCIGNLPHVAPTTTGGLRRVASKASKERL